MAYKTIGCVFFNKGPRRFGEPVPILITTGRGPWLGALALSCNNYAHGNGWSHWVMPDTVSTPPRWLVFECTGRGTRRLLTEKPTQEAAEMWLVSLG